MLFIVAIITIVKIYENNFKQKQIGQPIRFIEFLSAVRQSEPDKVNSET